MSASSRSSAISTRRKLTRMFTECENDGLVAIICLTNLSFFRFPTAIDTENVRVRKMQKLLSTWNPPMDIFAQRYGHVVSSGLAALTGIYFTSFFRQKLRLQGFGRIAMYTSTTYFPAMVTGMLNYFLIAKKIIDKEDTCVVCMATKSAVLQTIGGVVYPLFFSAIMGAFYATRYWTYSFPPNMLVKRKDTIDSIKILYGFAKEKKGFFIGMVGFAVLEHFAVGYFIGKHQQLNIYNMYSTLLRDEQERLTPGWKEANLEGDVSITKETLQFKDQ